MSDDLEFKDLISELKQPRDPRTDPREGDVFFKLCEDGVTRRRRVNRVAPYMDGFMVFYNARNAGTWLPTWLSWAVGTTVEVDT